MASSGPNGSTSATNDTDAGTSSSLLTNIAAEDGSGTTASLTAGADTKTLKIVIASFSLPATAVIDGIVAEVKPNSNATSSVKDTKCQLLINGSTSPDNKALGTYFGTSFAWQSYGSTTDKWGYTGLTGADVNAGVTILWKTHNDAAASRNSRVDYAQVTIYYTAGYEDSGTVAVALVPSGTDVGPYADSGTESLKFTPSGTDLQERIDAATQYLALTPSVTQEGKYWADADTELFKFTPSGTEQRISDDSSTEYLKFLISTVGEDFATIPLSLIPNATEVYTSGFRPERRMRGQGK